MGHRAPLLCLNSSKRRLNERGRCSLRSRISVKKYSKEIEREINARANAPLQCRVFTSFHWTEIPQDNLYPLAMSL